MTHASKTNVQSCLSNLIILRGFFPDISNIYCIRANTQFTLFIERNTQHFEPLDVSLWSKRCPKKYRRYEYREYGNRADQLLFYCSRFLPDPVTKKVCLVFVIFVTILSIQRKRCITNVRTAKILLHVAIVCKAIVAKIIRRITHLLLPLSLQTCLGFTWISALRVISVHKKISLGNDINARRVFLQSVSMYARHVYLKWTPFIRDTSGPSYQMRVKYMPIEFLWRSGRLHYWKTQDPMLAIAMTQLDGECPMPRGF